MTGLSVHSAAQNSNVFEAFPYGLKINTFAINL